MNAVGSAAVDFYTPLLVLCRPASPVGFRTRAHQRGERNIQRRRAMIRRYAGVECPAPAKSAVSLLVGHSGSDDVPFGRS